MEKIFSNKEFIKDKTSYNLVDLILTNKNYELKTDNESYFFLTNGGPIWVWTKDNLEIDKLKEVISLFEYYINNKESIQFTVKENIFNIIKEEYKYYLLDNYFKEKGYYLKMRAYEGKDIISPNNLDRGFLRKPTKEDLDILIEFSMGDVWDTLNEEVANKYTYEDAREVALNNLKKENFYVLEVDGKVVAQGSIAHFGVSHARITNIYTAKDERKKGYGKIIVYKLCEIIKKNNLIPFLYADGDYLPSNKCYTSLGFKAIKDLYNIRFGNKK